MKSSLSLGSKGVSGGGVPRIRVGNTVFRIRNILVCIVVIASCSVFYVFHLAHAHLGPLSEEANAVYHQQHHPFAKHSFAVPKEATSQQLQQQQQKPEQNQQQKQAQPKQDERRKLVNTSEGNEHQQKEQEHNKRNKRGNRHHGKDDKPTEQEIEVLVADDESKKKKGNIADKILQRVKAPENWRDNMPKHPGGRPELPQRKRKNAEKEEQRPKTKGLDPLLPDNFYLNHTEKVRYQVLPYKPKVKWLGVLLDAGRHYFPIPWIKRLLVMLHKMRYNLLHLRLTDDQTFNLQLKSYPNLAHPARTIENPDNRTYTIEEMKDLVKFAKSLNISIMPEINIPGHAGSWAGGINKKPKQENIIVYCPDFICSKGYGVPLNVSADNSNVYTMLKEVLKEVIFDVFDNPPLLHLGGDEVHMALPCFQELGIQHIPFDYNVFEDKLKQILQEINYDQRNVLRWEITGRQQQYINGDGSRAGRILHYWESEPGERNTFLAPDMERFFVSRHFYFDSNMETDGHDIFENSMKYVNHYMRNESWFPLGVIGGAFELSTEYWFDRNVIGRLLAVYLGTTQFGYDAVYNPNNNHTRTFESVYGELCSGLGLHKNVCGLYGRPAIPTSHYKKKWEQTWTLWKQDICTRLTDVEVHRTFRNADHQRDQTGKITQQVLRMETNEYFWDTFGEDCKATEDEEGGDIDNTQPKKKLQELSQKKAKQLLLDYAKQQQELAKQNEAKATKTDTKTKNKRKNYVTTSIKKERKVGVVIDLTVNNHVSTEYLNNIFEKVLEPLDMNIIQLRLISGHGFVVDIPALNDIEKRNLYHVQTDKIPKLNVTTTKLMKEEEQEEIEVEPQRRRKLLERRHPRHGGRMERVPNQEPFPTKELYTISELETIIKNAENVDIEVMPEISVATTAGGWVDTGYVLNCPTVFCGRSVLGDESRYVGGNGLMANIYDPNFLPFVYTVVREIFKTFAASSSYFHLGHDQRLIGLECYTESRNDDDPRFYHFEHKLQKLLDMIGIPLNKTLRFENEENTAYENRAGEITQYKSVSAKFADTDVVGFDQKHYTAMLKEEFWAKMDPFASSSSAGSSSDPGHDESGESGDSPQCHYDFWDIYMHTREWIDPGVPVDGAHEHAETMKPIGILAEVQFLSEEGGDSKHVDEEYWWNTLQMPQRLLAFRMATLMELPTYPAKEEFDEQFIHICLNVVGWDEKYCTAGTAHDGKPIIQELKVKEIPVLHVDSSAHLKKQCNKYTYEYNKLIPKDRIV